MLTDVNPIVDNSDGGDPRNQKIFLDKEKFWGSSNSVAPIVMSNEAFHGLTGIISYISPDTEADPAALLISFLVVFGNIIGRNCFYEVDATKHFPNLFTVLVGDSSRARKGTSWGIIKKIFSEINSDWSNNSIKSGLSSGEGLKYNVRDPVKMINEKGKEFISDKGIKDKRLLIFEGEFASALKVANRPGNTLSTTIRDAWDYGNLSTLTKHDAIKATGAHISILAHITKFELLKNFSDTDAVNGYANRFLWVAVKRSKLLPQGGNIRFGDLPYDEIKEAIEFGQVKRQIGFNDEAKMLWCNIYNELSIERYGIFDALSSRGEAQIIRMALIYAILDCSTLISIKHLKAAYAVWQYCEESVQFIFGERFKDNIADIIFQKITKQKRISATEVYHLFKNNKTKNEIEIAISELLRSEKIKTYRQETSGRPITYYEINERSQ